jgi:phosphatidyl-myo-inositol dimannoside synthase
MSKKEKILYLTPGCFDKGGISRYSRYQISAFQDIYSKKSVKVLSALGPANDSFETGFDVYWHGQGHNNSIFDKIKFVFHIVSLSLFWRPTIIYAAHLHYGGLITIIGKLLGIKSILNVYGHEVWSGLTRASEWGLRHVDNLLSDCHFTANYVEDTGYRPKGTTTVIWDCVDLIQFKPKPEEWSLIQKKYKLPNRNEHFIILTLGRLELAGTEHKGYDRLIKVFASLAQKQPNARLIFGGRGNYIPVLTAMSAELGVEDKVIFTGMVHDDDMSGLYSYAHVFSLVSDRGKNRGEGIPLTPLEAMSCGTPIIVGNHDGSQEAVFENKNGYVIDPFDFKEHEHIFDTLISSPELLNKKSLEAIEIAETIFSYTDFIEKHRKLMHNISS